MNIKKDIKILDKDDILKDPFNYTFKEISSVLGEKEAKNLFEDLYKKKNLNSKYTTMKIRQSSRGGDTEKYAFELKDGLFVETVLIKRRTGVTACLSTMVGCPVGCTFCASGKNGFFRNLTPSEIVQQVMLLKNKGVNRIVFMGMGEPLLNYDSLIKSIHILRDRNGLNFPTDGITISTIGPLDQLKKLKEEHLKIQLTLSLHATDQKTRNMLMPHMKNSNINETVKSALEYSTRHNRKITISYLLLPGINDRQSDVKQLSKWFKGKNVLINLLQYNDIKDKRLKKVNKQQLTEFKRKLERAGLSVKIRESRGKDINAACGQLVSNFNRSNRKNLIKRKQKKQSFI